MTTTNKDWRTRFETISDLCCELNGCRIWESEADALGLDADGMMTCATCRADVDAAREDDATAEESDAAPEPADVGATVRIRNVPMQELVFGAEVA
jgi:hypothetical protein